MRFILEALEKRNRQVSNQNINQILTDLFYILLILNKWF